MVVLLFVSTMLFVATTGVSDQLLEDTFDDPNREAQWESRDHAAEGVPSEWFVGPDGARFPLTVVADFLQAHTQSRHSRI